MDHFKLVSEYQPTGDQPQAIKELVDGFKEGNQFETLLGVTGSGKTFTMANVIAQLNKPTLVLAHNKTLAAQLYSDKSIYLSRLFFTSTHCNIINFARIYTVRHTNKTNIKMRQLPMKVLLNM